MGRARIRTDAENTTDGERLLEGKNANLRIMEKEDLPLVAEWLNNLDFYGEYNPLMQVSRADLQKSYDTPTSEWKWTWFFIEKKDGSKIGEIGHRPVGKAQGIGYALLPSERKKGYCSEAVTIMTDYLFLSKDIVRIQAHTDVRNEGSQRTCARNTACSHNMQKKALLILEQVHKERGRCGRHLHLSSVLGNFSV